MTNSVGLVVDDDPLVRTFFADALRRGGMEIHEAKSGIDALGVAQTVKPAFVVTDIQMPGLDGLELCRQLRQSHTTEKMVIVVVSGSAATQGDDAIAAGCDVVLPKPCPPSLLLATIQRLLTKPS